MKLGKISESVLKRSVLREIKPNRKEVLNGAGLGVDCAVLVSNEGDNVAVCANCEPYIKNTEYAWRNSVYKVLNNMAATGAKPVGITASILLPESAEEGELKQIMKQIASICKEEQIQILGGHTEVTDAVTRPVVTINGVGKCTVKNFENKAKPGQDLVVSKWVGLEGSAMVAREKKEDLLKRYSLSFIHEAENFDSYLSVIPEAAVAVNTGVSALHDVSRGGIFAALWELAERSGVGLEVDLKKIPIRQETVEICNYLDLNPYCLVSGGSLLMAAEDGVELARELEKNGIVCSVIGRTTDSNDRLIINEDEKRFLVPSKSDEIYNIF